MRSQTPISSTNSNLKSDREKASRSHLDAEGCAGHERRVTINQKRSSALRAALDFVWRSRHGRQQLAVHLGDEADADVLGTDVFALFVAAAVPETFGVHLRDHLA